MRLMTRCLNKLAGWGAAGILAALLPCPVQAAQMKDARVWAGPEYTRVVLDANGPLDYTISQKDGQIVVNLRGTDAAADFSAPTAQGLYRGLSQVRSGNNLAGRQQHEGEGDRLPDAVRFAAVAAHVMTFYSPSGDLVM